jgi:hypothetical protein
MYDLIYPQELDLPSNSNIKVDNFFLTGCANNSSIEIYEKNLSFDLDFCDSLLDYFKKFNKYPVNLSGLNEVENQSVGSHRATVYNTELAHILTEKLSRLSEVKTGLGFNSVAPYQSFALDPYASVNHNLKEDNKKSSYRSIGVSPLFRYMEYFSGSKGHVPHYDAPYVYSDSVLTLTTGVLYLSTSDTGSTYFLPKSEQQLSVPMKDRDTSDWSEHYNDLEKCFHVYPEKGKIVLFNHQIPHGVTPFISTDPKEKRIMMRFDLIYQRAAENDK